MNWFGPLRSQLQIAATYNLCYNAAVMARQGVGCVVSLDGLVDTSEESPLCFRPLSPAIGRDWMWCGRNTRSFPRRRSSFWTGSGSASPAPAAPAECPFRGNGPSCAAGWLRHTAPGRRRMHRSLQSMHNY